LKIKFKKIFIVLAIAIISLTMVGCGGVNYGYIRYFDYYRLHEFTLPYKVHYIYVGYYNKFSLSKDATEFANELMGYDYQVEILKHTNTTWLFASFQKGSNKSYFSIFYWNDYTGYNVNEWNDNKWDQYRYALYQPTINVGIDNQQSSKTDTTILFPIQFLDSYYYDIQIKNGGEIVVECTFEDMAQFYLDTGKVDFEIDRQNQKIICMSHSGQNRVELTFATQLDKNVVKFGIL